MANLHAADRHRSGVPFAEVRVRLAPGVPQQAGTGGGPFVHHRDRLPVGPGHPAAAGRRRHEHELGDRAEHPGRAAAGDRQLPAQGRALSACAQSHAGGGAATGNLQGRWASTKRREG